MSQSHARTLGAALIAAIVSDLDLEGQRQVLELATELAGGHPSDVADQVDAWQLAYDAWTKTPAAKARANRDIRYQPKGRRPVEPSRFADPLTDAEVARLYPQLAHTATRTSATA